MFFFEADKGAPGSSGDDDEKRFTQAQVNALLAKEKRALREDNEAKAKRLDELSKQVGLSEATIDDLKAEAENLRTEHLTETEKAKRLHDAELKALRESNKVLETTVKEKDETLAKRIIGEESLKFASKLDAKRPDHLVKLLPNTPKVKVDDDGNISVTVKIGDKELSLEDAFKSMKADIQTYGDYFKNSKTPGKGDSANDAEPKVLTADDVVDEATYKAYEEQQTKISGDTAESNGE
jgi:AraC-like DNA-binding protein